MASSDPFYNRKPVPDEFIQHVGETGLTKEEEHAAREQKYAREGGDLRKFWNPKNKDGTFDPYYQRKRVSKDETEGVGETGLTAAEEMQNRERKYSVNGGDLRKFGDALHPHSDPYYSRKPVAKPEIIGVGETGLAPAEEYEVRDRKQSVAQLSGDPFQIMAGTGHRQSVSGVASAGAADARRRSSAVAPHMGSSTAGQAQHSHHVGETLAPIESRPDAPTTGLNGSANTYTSPTTTTTTTTTTSAHRADDGTGHITGNTGHTAYYDTVTNDSVAPHEVR